MKIKRILILILFVICLTGCTSKVDDSADRLSKIIIELHNTNTPDLSKLNKDELEVLNKFRESEKEENKEINLSKILPLSEQSYTENDDTLGIYKKGNDYYIKYKDINWINEKGNYYAIIDIDHKEDALYKSTVPILYKDTHDNDKYYFRKALINKDNNRITYTYKSLKDSSGLIIDFYIENNKINNIELTYKDTITTESNKKNISLTTIIYPILLGILVFIIFKIYKKNA